MGETDECRYELTARILPLYEDLNYLLVVQVFVRIPKGAIHGRTQQTGVS